MAKTTFSPTTQSVAIKAPNFGNAVFHIKGTAPLVIHRFSAKAKKEIANTMKGGSAAKNKKKREPADSTLRIPESVLLRVHRRMTRQLPR